MSRQYSKISELIEATIDNRGKTVPTSDSGIPLLATNCIKHSSIYPAFENIRYVSEETHNSWFRAHIKPNDILFVNKGTPGRTCLVPNPCIFCVAQDMIGLRVNQKEIDYRYLFAIIRSEFIRKKIENFHVGLVIPHFKKSDIDNILIPRLKTKEEETAVGKLYISLSEKIELNNRINRELEAMAKTLYDYWFVQFDFPYKKSGTEALEVPYKSSGGKMVYNSELKREIPEGWENGTLGDISDLVRGVTYDASDIKEENDYDVIPILRATNISGNVIDLDNMVFVPKQNVSANQVLNKFDILITMSSGSKDHIGKNGFFYFDKEVAFGAFCAKIVAKDKYRFYVYSYTQSDFMFSTIKNECLGTNINNLNGSLVKGFKIVIPPVDLVEKFNNEVLSIYEMIGNNHKQNQQLSELRDWLLPMLMNGQVSIMEIDYCASSLI